MCDYPGTAAKKIIKEFIREHKPEGHKRLMTKLNRPRPKVVVDVFDYRFIEGDKPEHLYVQLLLRNNVVVDWD